MPTITGDHESRVSNVSSVLCIRERCGCAGGGKGLLIQKDRSGTLAANNDQFVLYNGETITNKTNQSKPKPNDPCHTLGRGAGRSYVVAIDRASFNQGQNAQFDFEVSDSGVNSTVVSKGPSAVCYSICSDQSNSMKSFNPHSGVYETDSTRTLDKNGSNPTCNQGGTAVCSMQALGKYKESKVTSALKERDYKDATGLVCKPQVRRLTPLECERLQGFPDQWTDIGDYIDTKGKKRKTSDSARYKALGNSIALPYWKYMLGKLMEHTEDHTMASLFDGIGGFPLIWQELGGECLWASEIEEFCIAVTKYHFGEE